MTNYIKNYTSAYNHVLETFESNGLNVFRKSDIHARAQAPGHSVIDDSVAITDCGNGSVGLWSFSDPSREGQDQVLAALGLTMADLTDRQGVTYAYTDGRNVHRSPDKKFKQSGRTKGTACLYRLERLAEASTVYVTEGEKCVHALETLGVVATTTPMGAGKADKCDLTPLHGKNVVIVADKDDAGLRHATQLVSLLDGKANVRVVEAKVGKDSADHVSAEFGVDDFVPVTLPAIVDDSDGRPKIWNATDLDESRRVEWLATNRIPKGAITYMLGPEGIGKSMFLGWLTAHITTGAPFGQFGLPARDPADVVLVLTEDDWSTVALPRLELAGANLAHVKVMCSDSDGSGSPTFPDDMPALYEAGSTAALVIVDAWADTLPGKLSVKDPQQARKALHPWKEFATRTGAAVLLSGHTNRETSGNVRNSYGMTGELRKKARMTLLAQPDPDEEGVFVIGPEKSNVAGLSAASRFKIEPVQVFDPTDDSDGTVPQCVYVGEAKQSARDMFTDAAERANGASRGKRSSKIHEWLREQLADGPRFAADLIALGDANDFSDDQLKRARKKVGISSTKKAGVWVWELEDVA